MTLNELKEYIGSLTSHVLFDYNGKNCGIDPINRTHFDMWYGDDAVTMHRIDDVFITPFFDGKSLDDIFDEISNLE